MFKRVLIAFTALLILILISTIYKSYILRFSKDAKDRKYHTQSYINNNVHNYPDLVLVLFNKLPHLYYDKTTRYSFAEICQRQNFVYATNGQFFKANKSPAGLLILNGELINQVDKTDPQIDFIVIFDYTRLKASIVNTHEFNPSLWLGKNITAFQTGPLIIKDNTPLTSPIKRSLNGLGAYKRTLLGISRTNQLFFIVTKKPYDLITLARKILSLPELKKQTITVINLDGGPSTWLCTQQGQVLVRGKTTHIPLVLGVPAK